MLKEKVTKMMKLACTGLMLTLGAGALVLPAGHVEAATLQEVEPNDNLATATYLPLNTWMQGTMEENYAEDWYKVVIPKQGVSQIEIKPDIANAYESASWNVRLIDENRHEFREFTTHSYKDFQLGLAPGTYYLKVSEWYGTKDRGRYNVMMHYTQNTLWEQERYYGDKSLVNANISYVNKQYTGTMYCGYDVDYYRFKLSGKNNIDLKFFIDETVANPGRWKIEFIEYDSRKSLGSEIIDVNKTFHIENCSGDLLVKISDWSSTTGKMYHIQATATPIVTATPTPKPTVAPTKPTTPSNNNTTTTTTVKKPSATKITSIKAGKRQATVYWKKASNATGYYVYRSTKAKSGYKKIATVNGKTSYKDKKSLKSKKTYYYKIVSYRKSGSKILKSKTSAYKKVKVK